MGELFLNGLAKGLWHPSDCKPLKTFLTVRDMEKKKTILEQVLELQNQISDNHRKLRAEINKLPPVSPFPDEDDKGIHLENISHDEI